LFCYYNHARNDEVTARMRQHAQGWRDVVAMDDDAVAKQIREDAIDILIDLAGHMAGNRLLVLARKPAPVQATYLGYPNGTGLKQIDWRISDAIADPPGMTEAHCVERIARLDRCAWCYRPPEDSPEPIDAPAERPITFASFNNFAKVHRETLNAWGEIVRMTPGSRLLLKSKALGDVAAREVATRMVSPETLPPGRLT